MLLLPIISRELGVLARRKKTYVSRLAAASIAALTMVWVLLAGAGQTNLAGQGALLFETLSVIGFGFAVLSGPVVAADALSRERREGTLGFLFLTPLKGWDVVLGKMATFSMSAVFALIAMLPMLSIGFLLGGIAPGQVAQIALVLLNTLFLSLAAGLFISTFSSNDRRAMVASALLMAALAGAPFLFVSFGGGRTLLLEEHPHWLQFSPMFGLFVAQEPQTWLRLRNVFFVSVFQIHLLGWALLALGALFLPSRAKKPVQHPLWLRIKAQAQEWQYGTLDKRQKVRAELLDENPFLWLSGRHRLKKAYAWGAVGLILLIWMVSAWRYPDLTLPMGALILFLIHLLLKVWITSEACSIMVEHRRSGAWEVLLPCPVTVKEIADGHLLALRRQFLRPIVVLVLLEIFIYAAGSHYWRADAGASRAIVFAMLIVLPFDLWALRWTALWASLRTTSVNKALLVSIFRILLLPWLLFIALQATWPWWRAFFQLYSNYLMPLLFIFLWILLSLAVDFGFGSAARRNFLLLFRLLAERRLEAPIETAQRRSQTPPDSAEIYLTMQRRKWLLRTAVLFLAITTMLGLYRLRLHWQVQQRLKRVEAAGHPIHWEQFARWHSPPPVRPSLLETELAKTPVLPMTSADRQYGNNNYLSKNARLLELIHTGASLRSCFAPIDYLAPLPSLRSSLSIKVQRVRSLEHLLILDANSRLALRDWVKTMRDLDALFEMAEGLENEPHLLLQQQRFRCLRQTVLLLQSLLGRQRLAPEELLRLRTKVIEAAKHLDLVPAFACERFLLLQMLNEKQRSGNLQLGGAPRGSQLGNLSSGFSRIIGEHDRELIALLDYSDRLIEIASMPFPDRRNYAATMPDAAASLKSPLKWQTVSGPMMLAEQIQVACLLRLAQFALNIELYQSGGGSYSSATPQELAQLSVEDPNTGQPLLLRKEGPRFVLYSPMYDAQDLKFTLRPKGEP